MIYLGFFAVLENFQFEIGCSLSICQILFSPLYPTSACTPTSPPYFFCTKYLWGGLVFPIQTAFCPIGMNGNVIVAWWCIASGGAALSDNNNNCDAGLCIFPYIGIYLSRHLVVTLFAFFYRWQNSRSKIKETDLLRCYGGTTSHPPTGKNGKFDFFFLFWPTLILTYLIF